MTSIQSNVYSSKICCENCFSPSTLFHFRVPGLWQQAIWSWSRRNRRTRWSRFFHLHENCWSCTHGFKAASSNPWVPEAGYKTSLNLDPFQQMAMKYGRKQQKEKKQAPPQSLTGHTCPAVCGSKKVCWCPPGVYSVGSVL